MGYETVFHLVDIKIKPSSVNAVNTALEKGTGRGLKSIEYFLSAAVVDVAGFLQFLDTGDGPYEPCEGENSVQAMIGTWYEAEKIARWVRKHSEKDGRMVFHSLDSEGAAFGWEFNGKGKMRYLELGPAGKWE